MPSPLASTATLIRRIQLGEAELREELVRRCLPHLRRWAHGRLPTYGRHLSETDDLIQITLMRAMGRLESFEPEREGAFLAYLRQILLNTVRNEIRTTQRRPATEPLDPNNEPPATNRPVQDQLADAERYEIALEALEGTQRQAVVLRCEFGLSYPEIAEELNLPSADAVRMSVSRGLLKIAGALT